MKNAIMFCLMKIPFIARWITRRKARIAKEQKNEHFFYLVDFALSKAGELKNSTSVSSPKMRATIEALAHYQCWQYWKQGLCRFVILYPLVFKREFKWNIFSKHNEWKYDIALLLEDPSRTQDLDKEGETEILFRELDQAFDGEREWDWLDMNFNFSREVSIDFLETFKNRYTTLYQQDLKKTKSEKTKRLEHQIDLVGQHLRNFETIKCPNCDHSHILSQGQDPYLECEECETDLVYFPSTLEPLMMTHFSEENCHEVGHNMKA